MEFTKFTVYSSNWDSAFLEWELSPTLEDIRQFRFDIYRGFVQSELSKLTSVSYNNFLFEDTTTDNINHDNFNTLYYQIKVVNLTNEQLLLESDVKEINQLELDWVSLEIIRRDEIALRSVFGQPFLLMKLKHTGQQCSCYDYTLGRKLKVGQCLECYDTNWVGGYYNPVKIYGAIGSWGESTTVKPNGPSQNAGTMFFTSYYPKININDIIADREGNRWVAVNKSTSRNKSQVVKQILNLALLGRAETAAEYPLDLTVLKS